LLRLVFALFIFVRHFALFIGGEKDHLAQAFVGINFGGQGSGVADFERHEAFPLRLEWRDIDDDSAARISGLADANRQYIARDAKIFH